MLHKKSILHISFDYPDNINNDAKTSAIKDLVDNSMSFDHVVISLNRRVSLRKFSWTKTSNIYSISFFMPSYGIFMKKYLQKAACNIANLVNSECMNIDIIHAHKMSIEGLLAYFLSKLLSIPFLLTVRGDTDTRTIKYKPTYRWLYKKLLEASRCNFVLAPWAAENIEQLLPISDMKWVLLPNFLKEITPLNKSSIWGGENFLTVFRLQSYKRKNIINVFKAIRFLKKKGLEIYLDIAGGGKEKIKIENHVKRLKLDKNISFLGNIQHSKLFKLYPQYCGLINPSLTETFGNVYIEALSCGIPVIYSAGTGIDGYFDKYRVGVKVNPFDYISIANAIESLFYNSKKFKNNISIMIQEHYMDRFLQDNAISHYERHMHNAIEMQLD